MRVVSLLPSTTEILYAVGAGPQVVGVTFECDYPPAARSATIVSTSTMPAHLTPAGIDGWVRAARARGEDLYHLDAGALAGLEPDLVVTQDLCAVCAVDVSVVDDALAHLGCRADVVTIDPHSLSEVWASIVQLGARTGHEVEAAVLVENLLARLERVRERAARTAAARVRPRVLVLEWVDPPFAPGHWIPEMIELAGGEPVLATPGTDSRPTTWAAIDQARPDVVVVAPCGYDRAQAQQQADALRASARLPAEVQLWAVDANASWARPGPRLLDGVEELAERLAEIRGPSRGVHDAKEGGVGRWP